MESQKWAYHLCKQEGCIKHILRIYIDDEELAKKAAVKLMESIDDSQRNIPDTRYISWKAVQKLPDIRYIPWKTEPIDDFVDDREETDIEKWMWVKQIIYQKGVVYQEKIGEFWIKHPGRYECVVLEKHPIATTLDGL